MVKYYANLYSYILRGTYSAPQMWSVYCNIYLRIFEEAFLQVNDLLSSVHKEGLQIINYTFVASKLQAPNNQLYMKALYKPRLEAMGPTTSVQSVVRRVNQGL